MEIPSNKTRPLNWSLIAIFVLLILGVNSCKEHENAVHELVLDSKYAQIKNIHSIAKCKGPDGNYSTEVISKEDGYLFFSQVYEYRDAPFMAELRPENKGYAIDGNKNILDTLSNLSMEMIRSHDFHRIHTHPSYFFNEITFEKKVDAQTDLYAAIDKLNNPVKLFYDRSIKQIKRIEFLNMMDPSEQIEIIHTKWMDSEYGSLAKEIEIVQAKKDTFHFSFDSIKIN